MSNAKLSFVIQRYTSDKGILESTIPSLLELARLNISL